MIKPNKLLELFINGKNDLLTNDLGSILTGVSERNLVGRLAIYLENRLNEYNIEKYYADPEYNRGKDGSLKIVEDLETPITIQCDLIIHSRGEQPQDNLLAIEMKKSTCLKSEKVKDKKRLIALTREPYEGVWLKDGDAFPELVCGYILGIYMEINIKKRQCYYEQYIKGAIAQTWSESF